MAMRLRVEVFEQEFEAREIERIAGPKVDRQKDWRRRKAGPARSEPGRYRADVDALLTLGFMTRVSDSIKDMDVARHVADMAAFEARAFLESLPGMVNFVLENGDPWVPTDREKVAIRAEIYKFAWTAEIVFVPLPVVDGGIAAHFVENPVRFAEHFGEWPVGLYVNIKEVVSGIAAKLNGPVITYMKTDPDKLDDPHKPASWNRFFLVDVED
jgi:hypothetical protein